MELYRQYGSFFENTVAAADPNAPAAVLVIASNKGLCGKFNSQTLKYAMQHLAELENVVLCACGKKAINYFKGKGMRLEKEYILNDVPSYLESTQILSDIISWRRSGKVSDVYVIYPKYINMMNQEPDMCTLFAAGACREDESILFVPDKGAIEKNAETVFRAMFYKLVLESAIGAQAATLMTMRSAFDTATEYAYELEKEINRMRQSAVTADVIETSAERADQL